MEAEEEIKLFESTINEIDRKLVSTKPISTNLGIPAHLLTHPLTHSLTHSPTHSLTQSITDESSVSIKDIFVSPAAVSGAKSNKTIPPVRGYADKKENLNPVIEVNNRYVEPSTSSTSTSSTHSLTYSLTYSLTGSLTQSLTNSLTHILAR